MLAEHHIALNKTVNARNDDSPEAKESVGIICTGLKVKECIDRCTEYLRRRPYDKDEDALSGPLSKTPWSEVIVEGHVDTKFAYIRDHLE